MAKESCALRCLLWLAVFILIVQTVNPAFGSLQNENPSAQENVSSYPTLENKGLSNDTISRAVILTAIPPEYEAVVGHLDNLSTRITAQGNIYQIGDFHSKNRNWKVAAAQIGMYNINSAEATERSISIFKPDVILFVGTAGGFQGVQAEGYAEANVGDVIAASKVYDYTCAIDRSTGESAWPEVYRPTYRILQIAKYVAQEDAWKMLINRSMTINNPKAVVGPIASGGFLVASNRSEIFQFLQEDYSDAVAVDMEGAGFLEAAYANPGVEALLVRGISDKLNDFERLDIYTRERIASDHASAFAFQVLSEIK
jgi:nucleoside phosphorylase